MRFDPNLLKFINFSSVLKGSIISNVSSMFTIKDVKEEKKNMDPFVHKLFSKPKYHPFHRGLLKGGWELWGLCCYGNM